MTTNQTQTLGSITEQTAAIKAAIKQVRDNLTIVDQTLDALPENIRNAVINTTLGNLAGYGVSGQTQITETGTPAPKKVKATKGHGRKTAEQMAELTTRVLTLITSGAGTGRAQIAETVNEDPLLVSRVLQKLLKDKTIKMKGERRTATYVPAAKH